MKPSSDKLQAESFQSRSFRRAWGATGIALVVLIVVFVWTEPSTHRLRTTPVRDGTRAMTSNESRKQTDVLQPTDALSTATAPMETAPTEEAEKFELTLLNPNPPPSPPPAGMVWIPGGEFSMGCLDPRESICGGPDAMPDARPIHRVSVAGFWMDETEVTNAQFQQFVEATNHVTVAELPPRPEDVPDVPADKLVAGSIVYTPTAGPVPLTDHLLWWRYEPGASWRHPDGPNSDLKGKENYPVVHLAYPDVEAYCKWASKRLPTEAEWEFAARGGKTGEVYSWGNDFQPNKRWMANIFQGTFPVRDEQLDGFAGLAPVMQFPPNPFGLYDMAGNVWEWCSDFYRPDYYQMLVDKGGTSNNPQGPLTSFDPAEPGTHKRVHRGGSFLCTDAYCTRYMLGSRGKGELLSGSNHTGFRCVLSPQQNSAPLSEQ